VRVQSTVPPPEVRPASRNDEPETRSARQRDDERHEETQGAERALDDERPPSSPSERSRPTSDGSSRRAPSPRQDEPETRHDEPRGSGDERGRVAPPTRGPNGVDARLRVGFAVVANRVRTNGTSPQFLGNYEYGATLAAIGAQLGYSRAWHELRLHLDARFLAAFAGSATIDTGPTTRNTLKVLTENISAGVALGGAWRAAGGVDLRLRLGVDAWINQIEGSEAPLSIAANTVVGMTVGFELALPAIVTLADRPLGFRVRGGVLAPATRIQRDGLKTSPSNSTTGGYFGFALQYGLLAAPRRGQLHLELSYDVSLAYTHFFGTCPASTSEATRLCRDDTVDDANHNSAAHVAAIGLYYQY